MDLHTRLKNNYDKLLHILGTFTVMCFLCAWFSWHTSAGIMMFMQAGKMLWNHQVEKTYRPAGDLLANAIGFGLYALYVGIN